MQAEKPVQARANTRAIVELVLLYLGVPAVTLYPLGFVALGIQLWRDPFFPYTDFTTVWEALSLINRTVVIATGIRLIYLSLVATAVGAGAASLILTFLRRRKGRPYGNDMSESLNGRLWSVLLFVLLPVAVLLIWSTTPIQGWSDAEYLGAFVLLSVGGGTLVGYVRMRGRNEWFFPALIIAYIASVCAALCLAALWTPGLPLVEIDTEPGIPESDCLQATGKTFVKLAEGLQYWHLYNQDGLFAVPHEDLHLIRYKHCPEYLYRS
jgi:hypothetical protein